MQNRTIINSFFGVASSNLFKLISSILISFLIPTILGVVQYGNYRVFILYLSYVGLFHFGFIDGIYLKFGGTKFKDLVKTKFIFYTYFIVFFEFFVGFLGILFSFLIFKGDRQFIFIMVSINLIALNLTSYYQFISQITLRFKEFSVRMFLLAIFNLFITLLMYFYNISDFKIYIILIVLVNYLLLIWYFYTYRNISFGKFEFSFRDIKEFFSLGIPLLFSNLVSILILLVDKQIIEILFPIEIFSLYSFAFSLLLLVNVFVSAVGTVLYPTIKSSNNDENRVNYQKFNKIIILFVGFGLVVYFPLAYLIPIFLPDYSHSISIVKIIFPSLLFSSSITALKHNYFKAYNKNFIFLIIGIFVLVLSILINLIAYFYFKNYLAIAISSLFPILLWYIFTEYYLVRYINIKWKENSMLVLIIITIFYYVTNNLELISGAILYISAISFIIVYSSMGSIISLFKK